jgi:hypothetical protein
VTRGQRRRVVEVRRRRRRSSMYVFSKPRVWSARRAGKMRPGMPEKFKVMRMKKEDDGRMLMIELVKSRICFRGVSRTYKETGD